MAFVPLSFVFGAKNKGADAEMKKSRKSMQGLSADMEDVEKHSGGARKGFNSIGDAARTMGKVVRAPFAMMGKMFEGIERRVGQFNLASISESIQGLTGQTGNLSDEMDSAFASNAKAVKPMLAMIGKTGKELRKLTSQAAGMAYGMNVSAETVGKVMVELETAGGPAKKGLDALNMSTKDFVKFAEVSGMEVQNLASLLGDMQTSWGMTDKQAAATADSVLAYGQAAGIGAEGLKKLDPLMEKMNGLLADAPPDMQLTGDQMQGLAISATKLAGAYREMGATQEQAMEYSEQTAELFVKESMAFQKAQEGRGEMGDFTKNLMPVLKQWGSWEEFGRVLKVGATDSTKGMVGLNKIVQEASAKGFGPTDVLMRQLLGTIQETSPAMAWLAQNTNAGEAALQKFDAMTVQSSGAIKKLGIDGFSSGLTLQDSFDRARLGMWHMIRGIGGKEVQGMVQTQMRAYRDMGKTIVELGNDKTWGPLIHKAVILKRMGLRGLMMSGAEKDKKGKLTDKGKAQQSKMAKTFAGMELAAGAIEDVTGAMNPLMTTLGKFGPLGTLAGGLATWFAFDKKQQDDIIADLQPVWAGIKEGAGKIWYGTDKDEKGGLTGGLKSKLEDGWKQFKDWVVETGLPLLGSALKTVGSVLGSALTKGYYSAMDTLFTKGEATKPIVARVAMDIVYDKQIENAADPYDKFAARVNKAFADANMEKWRKQVEGLEDGIYGHYDKNFKGGPLGSVQNWMTGVQNEWFAITKTMYDTSIFTPMITNMKKFQDGWKENVSDPLSNGKKSVEEWGMSVAKWFTDAAAHPKEFGQSTRGAFDEFVMSLDTLKQSVSTWGLSVGASFMSAKQSVSDWGSSVGTSMAEFFSAENMQAKVDQFIIGPFKTAIGQMGGLLTGAFDGLVGIIESLDPMKLAKPIGDFFMRAWSKVKEIAGAGADIMSKIMSWGTEFGTGLMSPGGEDGQSAGAGGTGVGLGTSFTAGIAKGVEANKGAVMGSIVSLEQNMRDNIEANSPPKLGPLSGSDTDNPMYTGGYGMMNLIATGITAGAPLIQAAMSTALVTSIQFAMGAYETEAMKLLSASEVMAKVADKVVRNLSGTGVIKLDSAETKVLKASLDVPGMAGVTGAILADGNMTRKVLERIAKATEGMYENMGGQAGKGKPIAVTMAAH